MYIHFTQIKYTKHIHIHTYIYIKHSFDSQLDSQNVTMISIFFNRLINNNI